MHKQSHAWSQTKITWIHPQNIKMIRLQSLCLTAYHFRNALNSNLSHLKKRFVSGLLKERHQCSGRSSFSACWTLFWKPFHVQTVRLARVPWSRTRVVAIVILGTPHEIITTRKFKNDVMCTSQKLHNYILRWQILNVSHGDASMCPWFHYAAMASNLA